jgi:hypothetical protein
MPGFLLHKGATVLCIHTGDAQPTSTSLRVRVGGQPIVVLTTPYGIKQCKNPTPPASNGPCVTAKWIKGATRVFASRVPVLLQDSAATCLPTGTGVKVVRTQLRVKGI